MIVVISLSIVVPIDPTYVYAIDGYVDSCSIDGIDQDCCSIAGVVPDGVFIEGCFIPTGCPFNKTDEYYSFCEEVVDRCEDAFSYSFLLEESAVEHFSQLYHGFKKCGLPLKAENVRPESEVPICIEQKFYHSKAAAVTLMVFFGLCGACFLCSLFNFITKDD